MAFQTKPKLNAETAVVLGGKDDAGKSRPRTLEGYFLGTRITPDSGYGPGKLHIFQTKDGNVGVWGKTDLNNQLTSELTGACLRVTFTGMSNPKKGRRPGYLYQVEVDYDNKIDVSGINVNAAPEEEPNYGDDDNDVDADAFESPEEETPPQRVVSPKQAAQVPTNSRKAELEAKLAAMRKQQ